MRPLCAILIGLVGSAIASAAPTTQPTTAPSAALAAWSHNVKIAPVADGAFHSMHAYFNTCPESPDGKYVLFYTSTSANGQENGEIRILERATGKVTVLAKGISTEDAHRVACQQWVSGGKRVAFHNELPSKEWVVEVVDIDTGKERILARGRQLGFGQPMHDLLPLYGMHWNPGEHRGLELLNVETGEIKQTKLTPEAIRNAYPQTIEKQFGDKPISVFFPLLSPNAERVIFKLATPSGGDFRSKAASSREVLTCYDLKSDKFLFQQARWGHPAWHADSRHILNVGGIITDSNDGGTQRVPNMPPLPGSHPSYSPDGTLFVSDTLADGAPYGSPKGYWGVVVVDVKTGASVTLKQFDNSKGAKSWRVSHPHPIFSADGKRIYFNVSDGQWTRLHVAEIGG